MDPSVFVVVIGAAALHAGWNAVVKVGAAPLVSLALISAFSGLAGAVAIPVVGLPDQAAIPWLALSVVLHTAYRVFLARAYAEGDLGQVYPLARGTAPLLVTLATLVVLGEQLRPASIVGIAALSAGIIILTFRGGRTGSLSVRATSFALITSAFIAAYTLVDGIGGRAGPSPHAYAAWLLFLDGVAILLVLGALRLPGLGVAVERHWKPALAGGMMSAAAYWIVIWAMASAPIALVAALRETSVLFAALISALVLREPPTVWRSAGALFIVAGIAGIRMT